MSLQPHPVCLLDWSLACHTLELYPGIGLESSLVQGPRQQINSMDTIGTYGPK